MKIKQAKISHFGVSQQGDIPYVLNKLLTESGSAMVLKTETGFEVCAFSVIAELEETKVENFPTIISEEAEEKTKKSKKKQGKGR